MNTDVKPYSEILANHLQQCIKTLYITESKIYSTYANVVQHSQAN